jgi:hypothetical protein
MTELRRLPTGEAIDFESESDGGTSAAIRDLTSFDMLAAPYERAAKGPVMEVPQSTSDDDAALAGRHNGDADPGARDDV